MGPPKPDVSTGAAAIAHSFTATGNGATIRQATIKFSVAPTTSENITVTLNANAGAAYDVALLTYDPSVDSATSVVWRPVGGKLVMVEGDSLDVAYTNTDTRTYGSMIYWTEGAD